MAKILLKIGHELILLPNDKGVMTVINTLGKGMSVERDYTDHHYLSPDVYIEEDRELKIEMQLLSTRDIVRTRKQALALERNAGPNSDGDDITKREV